MPLHEKHFTLAEARALLNEVRPRVRRLQECVTLLERKGFRFFGSSPVAIELNEIGFSKNGNGKHTFPIEYLELLRLLTELGTMGIQVKSLAEGLIDFPAIAPWGEEVYLCYLEGEADILFWHPLEGGFQGRQPVDGTFIQPGTSPGGGTRS